MRTFIAIELPLELKERIGALRDDVREQLASSGLDRRLSWTGDDKFHLTLRFLGETNPEQAEAIERQLAQMTARQRPFDLRVQELGAFPNWNRMRVLWVGVQGELDRLRRLQAQVEQAAQAGGFAPETKPFHGHITLARLRRGASRDEARRVSSLIQAEIVAHDWNRALGGWRVQELVFMRSELHPSGARYTVLDRFQLANEEGARGPASAS